MEYKVLNLQYPDKSDIEYKIINFPDGELQLEIQDSLCNFKDKISVETRIKCADDLFILLQAIDILKRNAIDYYIVVKYLMSSRTDRLFSYIRPISLNVVLDTLKGSTVYVEEPHFNIPRKNYNDVHNWYGEFYDVILRVMKGTGITMFPDESAAKRHFYVIPPHYLLGTKKRDVETGRITNYEVTTSEGFDLSIVDSKNDEINIIDDLCDGGGTFILAYNKLQDMFPGIKVNLYIAHAVQEKGLINVCSKFNKVVTTNSYDDWNKLNISNLKVINVWEK